jgi:hypothetical protein
MYQVTLSLERGLLTFRNPDNAGLYDRLPNHILQQRHFYPLFPARSEARVAIQESGLAEFVGGTPDMLILPSELGYFAKVVDLFCDGADVRLLMGWWW